MKFAVWIFNWKTACFLAVALCCGCWDEELAIEFIHSDHHVGNYDEGAKDCITFQYYTIANYKQIPLDSLYKVLNEHIFSIYPYEKYVENISRNPICRFNVYFYEKSLLVDYGKYIPDAIYYDENGLIDGYKHKMVAMVYNDRYDGSVVFRTILYDVDKYSKLGYSNIKWKKEDTIMVQSE